MFPTTHLLPSDMREPIYDKKHVLATIERGLIHGFFGGKGKSAREGTTSGDSRQMI